MTLLSAALTLASALSGAEQDPIVVPAVQRPTPPATARPLPAAVDPTRYRCKVAGAVLLGLAGAAIFSVLSIVVYRAAATPDRVSLEAGPRLGLGLGSIGLIIAGSGLLGYGLSPPRPASRSQLSSGAAALELLF